MIFKECKEPVMPDSKISHRVSLILDNLCGTIGVLYYLV